MSKLSMRVRMRETEPTAAHRWPLLPGLVVVMLAWLLPVGAWADTTEQLQIVAVSGSPSTAAHAPAAFLTDGDPLTAWQVSGSDSGWVELQLAEAAFITELVLLADAVATPADPTTVTIELLQDGVWQPFAGAERLPVSGDLTLDVSHDRAVTDRIALRVTGPDLNLASFAELEVHGVPAVTVYHRLAPFDLASSPPVGPRYHARNLFDGNPFTEWRARIPAADGILASVLNRLRDELDDEEVAIPELPQAGVVETSLPAGTRLTAIKIFVPERLQGDATVSLENAGVWQPVATLWDSTAAGWHIIELSPGVGVAQRIRLEVTGSHSVLGAISELEAWGYGPYPGDRLTAVAAPMPLATVDPTFVSFAVDRVRPRSLELVVDQPLAALEVQVNDQPVVTQPALALGNGRYLLRARVDRPVLWRGDNFMRVELPPGVVLHNVRVRTRAGDGTLDGLATAPADPTAAFAELGDDRLLSGGSGVVAPLDRELALPGITLIDRIQLYGPDAGAYTVSAWVAGAWQELPLAASHPRHDQLTGAVETDRLRITAAAAAPPYELRIVGSPTLDRAPTVRIVWPYDGASLPAALSDVGPVIGLVDNPDATVLVNGLPTERDGGLFWLPIEQLGLTFGEPMTITAVATDAAGRNASFESSVVYGVPAALHLHQPDTITYTTAPTFIVSGWSLRRWFTVEVDGEVVEQTRFGFSTDVALAEGLNVIEVQAFSRWTGAPVAYSTRRVVRVAETLAIQVDAPLPGTTVAADSITVSGSVDGAGATAVTVAGIAATVSGGWFSATGVPLAEGPNPLTVSASDEAGRSVELQLEVYRDSIAPALTLTAPTADQLLATGLVTITGTVTDASSVWVYANGELAATTGDSYTIELPFADGARSVQLSATDSAGNAATLAPVPFVVDTTPPESFTVTATPGGWTNDTQPVITFATTDATSGVAGYEVNVGGGPFVTATSPYQLSAQPDGEHTVRVRAFDHAGWSRIETVPIFIDTTSPPAPPVFLAVAGNGNIELLWDAPSEDVVSYHLTRTPPWPTGAVVVPATAGERYLDAGLPNGEPYTYQLWAVDRAANVGPPALSEETTVGVAVAVVEESDGTFVAYENIDLMIPQAALPAEVVEVHVTEVESPQLEELAPYPIMGPIYNFSAVIDDGTGTLTAGEHLSFEEPFYAQLSYDENELIDGFPEQNIGVYHFDPMWGRWFLVEDTAVDTENNIIHFSTNHFSDFSVQPTVMEDLSLQELQDVGHSPFKTEVTHQGITVSPQGGTVMTEATELVLPGKNGFDFAIKRVYDSATARSDGFGVSVFASISTSDIFPIPTVPGGEVPIDPDTHFKQIVDGVLAGTVTGAASQIASSVLEVLQNNGDWAYSTGLGWRLNLPYIRSANSTVLVRTPDGSFHPITKMDVADQSGTLLTRSLVMENHEGGDFTLKVHQVRVPFLHQLVATKKPRLPQSVWALTGATLTMADGTTYEMDALGRVTSITDPQGLNHITVNYSGLLLDTIDDSMGRTLRFEYSTGFLIPRISRIWVEDDAPHYRLVRYEYESGLFGKFGVVQPVLVKATDVGGRVFEYDYGKELLFSGELAVKVNPALLILDIFTGAGASTVAKTVGLQSVTVSGRATFELFFPLVEASGPGIGTTVVENQVVGLTYTEVEAADYLLGFLPTSIEFSINLAKRMVASRILTYENLGASPVNITTYAYDIRYYDYDQFVNYTTTINDGRARTVHSYGATVKERRRWIDQWDQFLDLASSLSPFTGYAYIREVHPIQLSTTTYDATTGTPLETVSREWDTATMRVTHERRERPADIYAEQTFRYDNWGNRTYVSDRNQVGTRHTLSERWSRYVDTNNAGSSGAPWGASPFAAPSLNRPIRRLLAGTVTANHQPAETEGPPVIYGHTYFDYDTLGQQVARADWTGTAWAFSSFAYHPTHGSPTEAISPIGHRTTWAYDFDSDPALYFITQTEHAVIAADATTTDLATRRAFEQSSGFQAWEQSPRGYVTEFTYDALGRTIRTVLPDDDDDVSWDPRGGPSATRVNNPGSTVAHDDIALHSDVTSPRGAFARYDYDRLGRLVSIDKHIRSRDANGTLDGGAVEHAVTTVTYNSWGQIVAVTNPLGATTNYAYDATGRLTTTTHPAEDGTRASRTVAFTYTTGTNTITDERGNLTIQVLDMADRVIEQRRFTDQGIIETRTSFDGLGNEVVLVDGNGNTTINRHDARNLLERTVLPEAEFFANGAFHTARPYVRIEYDGAGNRIAGYTSTAAGTEIAELAEVDGIGRTIRVTRPVTDPDSGATVEAITETYYDRDGNPVRIVDANNTPLAQAAQLAITNEYSARGQLLSETDQAGNRTTYRYDAEDNRIALTDPRQNSGAYPGRDFSALYHYDDLNRLILSELPPDEPGGQKLRVAFTYDLRGNVLSRTDPDGGITRNTYTPRNFLATETREGHRRDGTPVSYTTTYGYDAAGNQTLQTDNAGNQTHLGYDQLNRLVETIFAEGNNQLTRYDGNDNVISTIDGRGNPTTFDYDPFNRLTATIDAAGGRERAWYDTRGNQTRVEDANGNLRTARYDERSLLVQETDSLGQLTTLRYDLAGNLHTRTDPNRTQASFTYTPHYLVESVTYTNAASGQAHSVSYQYDESGFVTRAQDGGVVSRYNQPAGSYVPDPYGRITEHVRELDGRSFPVRYQYDQMQRITAVDVSSGPLARYLYNTMGELEEMPGYIDTPITYADSGLIDTAITTNGVTAIFAFDANLRLARKAYDSATRTLESYDYSYDDADNIIGINNSSYFYDQLNWLTAADLNGSFAIDVREKEAETTWRQLTGDVQDDHAAEKALFFATDEVELKLDYAATSIGVDLEGDYQISRIELDTTALSHRVHPRALSLWIADLNTDGAYTEITDWLLVDQPELQRITIRLREPVRTRFLKIHSHHDDRDAENQPVDAATIRNTRSALLTVTYLLDWRLESYTYDPKGNRLSSSITMESTEESLYSYYANSDRLKTDGRYGYIYDANGNLSGKATSYAELADGTLLLDPAGEEHWQYSWDLLNRLVTVTKNGTVVASYRYDADGLRVRRTAADRTTYGAYDIAGRIVYEEDATAGTYIEYVYGGTNLLARVQGTVAGDGSERETQFYLTDHLGSTVMVTDSTGALLWQEDLTPFGTAAGQTGLIEQAARFTGKDIDTTTGLYYYNARWFDPHSGRFISVDPARDGSNWYGYVSNNPLGYTDPTGRVAAAAVVAGLYIYGTAVATSPDLPHDLNELAYDLSNRDFVGATIDVVGIALPGVPASGMKTVVRAIEKVAPAARRALPAAGEALGRAARGVGERVRNIFRRSAPAASKPATATPTAPASSGRGRPDFVVGSDGTAAPVSQSRMRTGFDQAGAPSRPATTSGEAGRIHTIDTPHGPVDVRTMEGGTHHPRRAVTTRAGTNDPVRITGERFRANEPRPTRRAGSHLEQDP